MSEKTERTKELREKLKDLKKEIDDFTMMSLIYFKDVADAAAKLEPEKPDENWDHLQTQLKNLKGDIDSMIVTLLSDYGDVEGAIEHFEFIESLPEETNTEGENHED